MQKCHFSNIEYYDSLKFISYFHLLSIFFKKTLIIWKAVVGRKGNIDKKRAE